MDKFLEVKRSLFDIPLCTSCSYNYNIPIWSLSSFITEQKRRWSTALLKRLGFVPVLGSLTWLLVQLSQYYPIYGRFTPIDPSLRERQLDLGFGVGEMHSPSRLSGFDMSPGWHRCRPRRWLWIGPEISSDSTRGGLGLFWCVFFMHMHLSLLISHYSFITYHYVFYLDLSVLFVPLLFFCWFCCVFSAFLLRCFIRSYIAPCC